MKAFSATNRQRKCFSGACPAVSVFIVVPRVSVGGWIRAGFGGGGVLDATSPERCTVSGLGVGGTYLHLAGLGLGLQREHKCWQRLHATVNEHGDCREKCFWAPEKFIWGGWGALAAPFPTPTPLEGGYKGRLSISHVFHAYSMTKPLALSVCHCHCHCVTPERGGLLWLSAVLIHPSPPP